MTRRATSELDYAALRNESRRLDAAALAALPDRVRVAVLSDASTQHLVPILRVLFAHAGVAADIHAAELGAFETEVLDGSSALYRFVPDAVVLLPATQALRTRWSEHAPDGDRASFGEREAARLVALWEALAVRTRAAIVQATFVVPYERELGSLGLRVPGSLAASVLTANAELARAAGARTSGAGHALLCDLEGVASYVGKHTFVDEKLWTLAKTFSSLDHLPRVARAIVDVVLAARGRTVKCVVMDLDDTLWGGTVGDDGIEGIRIGHDGEGEAFRRFQHFLRELGRRGVALAVCSKNDPDVAIRVFREHPEMVLREADIAVFVASYDTKVDNLSRIRDTLGIGFDSMVFLDDNPFERNLVRHHLPDVIVPELPEDPSEYVRALSEAALFETASLTDEDRRRGALYREEASRRELARTFTDVDGYLASLDMRVTFARFDAFHVPRIVQLAARSNQWNLTTRRETRAECEALTNAGPDVLPYYVKLADKLGDHGLVSVVIAHFSGDHLEIDTWLMSCRVLARGVEDYAMNRIVAAAKERGAARVVGRYVPTSKNKMVRDFYARFGFEKIEEDPFGNATWTLDVARFVPKSHHLVEADG